MSDWLSPNPTHIADTLPTSDDEKSESHHRIELNRKMWNFANPQKSKESFRHIAFLPPAIFSHPPPK